MYKRTLNLPELLDKKSFFLFGARATGKTTLIQTSLPDALIIDLLYARTYSILLKDPSALGDMCRSTQGIIVIDEIQKLPVLLDEVHRLIQRHQYKFLLTGSSARKLKHGGANLLAGRARESRLYPLTSHEIDDFDLLRLLNRGGLPEIYDSDDPDEDLSAYVDTYLKEEIKAEAVTRNVAAFSEFLDIMARSNGQELNYESFASDLQISTSSFKNYVQILEDTLIGFRISGFTETKKRKSISRSKHYLFDLGVTRHLAKTGVISPKNKAFGDAFEHFIVLEVQAYISYARKKVQLSYWRSTSQFEVDLILDSTVAIEVKAAESISSKHLKGLRALMEEKIFKRYICIYTGEAPMQSEDGIELLPWRMFLSQLWSGEIV